MTFVPGEIVNVQYTGYAVVATVIEERERGWVLVDQVSDYEDYDHGPRFLAAAEFITRPGEPPAEQPMAKMLNALTGGLS